MTNTVTLKTNDEYNGMAGTVTKEWRDGTFSVLPDGETEAFVFEADEVIFPAPLSTVDDFFAVDKVNAPVCSKCGCGNEHNKLFKISSDKYGHATAWCCAKCTARISNEAEREAGRAIARGEWQAQEDYI